MDLRVRIVAAVERGSSIREAARRFAVSPSAAIKLMQRVRATGSPAPAGYGGHRRPLLAAYEGAAKACKAHGKHLGVGGIRADVEHVAELIELGARFIIAGSDLQYLMKSARHDVAALRKATS